MSTAAPAPRSAIRALSVLTAINLLNYLDRYVVSPLAPDLKRAMALSDAQLGWLVPAFMLVYMLAAPVFGAWGDRGSRTRPIALGVFIWSLATVLSGLARSYQQLLAGRALVGIGEAAYVAIAPALLADCFPVSGRGRVYSVLNMAIPVGSALGIGLGGLIGHHFGWKVLHMVHSRRTVARYEAILGIKVRDVFAPIGPDAERANAYAAIQGVANFWKAVSGDEKVAMDRPTRRSVR